MTLKLSRILIQVYIMKRTLFVIREIEKRYTKELQEIRNLRFAKCETLAQDNFGKTLISDDILLSSGKITGAATFDAKVTTADDNCLYRSASLILVGNQDLHLLLRLLTAIELFLHPSSYARHPKFFVPCHFVMSWKTSFLRCAFLTPEPKCGKPRNVERMP